MIGAFEWGSEKRNAARVISNFLDMFLRAVSSQQKSLLNLNLTSRTWVRIETLTLAHTIPPRLCATNMIGRLD